LAPGGELRDRYTKLYERASYGVDGKERLKAYHELVEMLEYEATPWVIIYQPREYFGMAEDIEWKAPSYYRPFTLPFRAGDIRFR
jgi:hypothetical protein